jgi:hypothetical protein
MMLMGSVLQIINYTEPGYKPLLLSKGWMVALLNADKLCEVTNAVKIERHVNSDEAFILWRGKGMIFTSEDGKVEAVEMILGAIYNVRPGGWHGVISTPDASWIIVENTGTNTDDTEVRWQTPDERAQLLAQLPKWTWEGPLHTSG